MTKKTHLKPVAAVVGAALVGSLSAIGAANAAENPFGASQLESGYMQLASSHEGGEKMKEGQCGEGKCGGDMKDKEGSCGGDMKDKEGSCGGDMKGKEGKCGEGKCGGDKKG
jgi:uncharacterized low-complexity protein